MDSYIGLLAFLLSCGVVTVKAGGDDYEKSWSYKTDSPYGPQHWYRNHSYCGGKRQSPINILTRDVRFHKSLGKLKLNNYDHVSDNMYFELENRNTDIAFKAKTKKGEVPQEVVFQGTTYRFFQFHFHWGSTSHKGSEHLIDFQSYAAEMHMIHYNTKYANISQAVDKPDGLLVWGHFLKTDSTDKVENQAFQKVMDQFSRGKICCNVTKIPSFSLKELLPKNYGKFYHYKGSLTTPPCYESVKWIVDKSPISVSEDQMKLFRALKNIAVKPMINLEDNDRPTQPLHNREVQRNFDDDDDKDEDEDSASVLVKPYSLAVFFLAFFTLFTL